MNKTFTTTLSALAALAVLAGCGEGATAGQGDTAKPAPSQAPAAPQAQKQEPITLRAYAYSGALVKEDFDKYVAAPVKAKFPNVTLEYVANGNGTSPQDLLTAGMMPDIIMTGLRQLITFQELDTVVDMRDLIKANKLDLNTYRKEAVDAIAGYGSKGEMYALPFYENFYMMAYNKDIFDRFSVPYPTDQMTWDDVLELAKKLTRTVDGVNYKGIQPVDTVDSIGLGLGLPYIDEKTGKARIQTDDWKRALDYTKAFNTIPGNEPKDPLNIWKGPDDFMKDKNVAMMPWFGSRLQTLIKSDKELGFNWDVVSFPSFKEAPGKTAEVDAHVFALSKASKHQDETFKVIQYLTSSEELQGNFVKLGRALPAIANENLMKQFGTEYPLYQSKNMQGVFKSVARQPHKANKYDELVRGKIRAAFADVISGKLDVNTALRTAEEEANKEIDSLMKK